MNEGNGRAGRVKKRRIVIGTTGRHRQEGWEERKGNK
jgi:hypothetical protein